MSIWESIKGWFHQLFRARAGGPPAEEVQLLTQQFRITLRASLERMRERCSGKPAFATAERLLADEDHWSWNRAYEVEQLFVDLYDDETLRTELACRVREAGPVLRPPAGAWYQEQLGKRKSSTGRRALLGRLINDLQWRYTVNEARRGYTKEITGRTGRVFVCVVGLFLIWALIASLGSDEVPPGDWKLLFLVASAGGWGAVFSMLTGLRGRLDASSFDDLKLSRSWWMLTARALIGLAAALVLLFFFVGGLLEGSLFPDMSPEKVVVAEGVTKCFLAQKDIALLIVWSFLAGFSERLVPSLLAHTENRLNSATPSGGASGAALVTSAPNTSVRDEADEAESEESEERDDGADADEPPAPGDRDPQGPDAPRP